MEITDDGYIVVEPIVPPEPRIKGVKCGKCGNKFDYGKTYGYVCKHRDCPLDGRELAW